MRKATSFALSVWLLLSSGCELIADFDRSKIPGAQVDSGSGEEPEEDAGAADAASPDGGGD